MGSDTYVFTPHAINVARFSYNRIDAHPAVTSGLKNEDFGINVPNTNELAQGLWAIPIWIPQMSWRRGWPRSRSTASSGSATRSSRSSSG